MNVLFSILINLPYSSFTIIWSISYPEFGIILKLIVSYAMLFPSIVNVPYKLSSLIILVSYVYNTWLLFVKTIKAFFNFISLFGSFDEIFFDSFKFKLLSYILNSDSLLTFLHSTIKSLFIKSMSW